MSESDDSSKLKEILLALKKKKMKEMSKGRKSRSKMWDFYTKLDRRTAECKTCNKVIKTSGNTTNLSKHLEVHSFPLIKSPTSPMSNGDGIDPVFIDMETNMGYELEPSQFDSPIPSSDIDDLSNEMISTTPMRPEIDYAAVVDFLLSHKKNDDLSDDDPRHSDVTNYLIYFICVDNHPSNVVQGEGFKELIRKFMPLYRIPSINNMNRLIDEKYEIMKAMYIEKFNLISHLSLACDIWCEKTSCRTFLAVTVFYPEEDALSSICVGLYELIDEGVYNDHIRDRLVEVLNNWKIDKSKVTAVLTDNGEDIVDAVVRHFGKSKHIRCFKDNLKLIKNCALNHSSIIALLEKIRAIVKWVQNNEFISFELNQRQLMYGDAETQLKKLVLDDDDNLFSICSMLKEFLDLSFLLNDLLMSKRRCPPMPSAIDLDIIKELLVLLKPLESMTTEISGDSFMAASKIVPLINCVCVHYSELNITTEVVNTIRIRLLNEMQKRFNQSDVCPVLALATILDPRFKNIHFSDAHLTARARKVIIQNIQNYSAGMADVDDYDFWSHHKNLIQDKNSQKTNQSSNKIQDELSMYLDIPVSPLLSDPKSQWDEMKSLFPGLYKEALKYFTIPASLTRVKNILLTDDAENSKIQTKQMMKYAFLASCKINDWF